MGLESRPGLIRVAALVTTPVDGRRDVVVGLTCGDGVVRVAFFRRECRRQLSPLTEKPVPLIFASEIVTADPPVLVNVSERLELLLFCTFPKESVDDDAAKVEPPLEPPLEPPGANPWQPVDRHWNRAP